MPTSNGDPFHGLFKKNPAALQAVMESFAPESELGKLSSMRCSLRTTPDQWFRGASLDERDRALLDADVVPFLQYGKRSFLNHFDHMKAREQFKRTNWKIETDDECKKLVQSAGATLIGFDFPTPENVHWANANVKVQIEGAHGAGFPWGFLATFTEKIRIFKGPPETCSLHPWDAMILRDCSASTDNLSDVPAISCRSFDILVMKMCEDFDHPWVIAAMRDVGPYDVDLNRCGCQDENACGCILPGSDHS